MKTHVLAFRILKNLDIKVMSIQFQVIALNSVQLHFLFISCAFFISHILIFMNLEIKESDVEDVEFQLDQDVSNFDENSANTSTQTL